MERLQTLADYLGTAPADGQPAEPDLADIAGDPKAFCKAVINSREFRNYIKNGLIAGSIPPAILTRVMDTAEWPAAAKRVEHTGKDGEPVEIIRRIVRVIIDPKDAEAAAVVAQTKTVH